MSRPSTLTTPPCSHELAGPRGARCPPAHTHALGPGKGKSGAGPSTLATLPRSRSRTPSRIVFTAASVMGPWSHHHLEIATAPAGFTRPGAQPSARRPPAACGGCLLAGPRSARRPPARTHALGPGKRKSGGGPSTLATPPRSRMRTPRHIASTAASVRGPWSAIAGARCQLAGGSAAHHMMRADPRVTAYNMFRHNAHPRKQRPSSPICSK